MYFIMAYSSSRHPVYHTVSYCAKVLWADTILYSTTDQDRSYTIYPVQTVLILCCIYLQYRTSSCLEVMMLEARYHHGIPRIRQP